VRSFDERAKDWDADLTKVERAHAIADAIVANVPLRADVTALDYGCGTGLLGFRLRPYIGDLTLADVSDGMLEVVRQKLAARADVNARAVKLDLVSDPLPQRRFDLVCTAMTLHHIRDTDAMLRRFAAVLGAAGYLCIADLDAEDGSFHGQGADVQHGFDRQALRESTVQAGLRVIRFVTAYTMEKMVGDVMRTYPIFLMVAQKPA